MPNPWGAIGETIARQFQQSEILTSFCKHKHTRTQLMNCLGWIASKFGSDVAEGRAINLRLTHYELGELIGSKRVTVTRLLCDLERKELLSRTDKQKIILRASPDVFLSAHL